MSVLKLFLYPFSVIYRLVMSVRNHLYDIGHKPSFEFDVPLIAVGNLNVGGSGKTPMVEYLVELLKDQHRITTLSRGYKRSTTGYRMAQAGDTAITIGDEPFQIFSKFGDAIHVAVGEDRVYAIPNILNDFPDTNLIVLDDAMQQRSIRPEFTILLTEFDKPFYTDHVLPYGRLREARAGARRANVIVVTKCPEQTGAQEQSEMKARISRYANGTPVFFTGLEYGTPVSFGKPVDVARDVVGLSGIAGSSVFRSHCESKYKLLKHFSFPDHHSYTVDDLRAIDRYCTGFSGPFSILTTEKDMTRLQQPEHHEFVSRWPIFFIPVRHKFLQDGPKFDELVSRAAKKARHAEWIDTLEI